MAVFDASVRITKDNCKSGSCRAGALHKASFSFLNARFASTAQTMVLDWPFFVRFTNGAEISAYCGTNFQ